MVAAILGKNAGLPCSESNHDSFEQNVSLNQKASATRSGGQRVHKSFPGLGGRRSSGSGSPLEDGLSKRRGSGRIVVLGNTGVLPSPRTLQVESSWSGEFPFATSL